MQVPVQVVSIEWKWPAGIPVAVHSMRKRKTTMMKRKISLMIER